MFSTSTNGVNNLSNLSFSQNSLKLESRLQQNVITATALTVTFCSALTVT